MTRRQGDHKGLFRDVQVGLTNNNDNPNSHTISFMIQVRVGHKDVSPSTCRGCQISVNSACDGMKGWGDGNFGNFAFNCYPAIEGRFVSIQKIYNDSPAFLEISEVYVFEGELAHNFLLSCTV